MDDIWDAGLAPQARRRPAAAPVTPARGGSTHSDDAPLAIDVATALVDLRKAVDRVARRLGRIEEALGLTIDGEAAGRLRRPRER